VFPLQRTRRCCIYFPTATITTSYFYQQPVKSSGGFLFRWGVVGKGYDGRFFVEALTRVTFQLLVTLSRRTTCSLSLVSTLVESSPRDVLWTKEENVGHREPSARCYQRDSSRLCKLMATCVVNGLSSFVRASVTFTMCFPRRGVHFTSLTVDALLWI